METYSLYIYTYIYIYTHILRDDHDQPPLVNKLNRSLQKKDTYIIHDDHTLHFPN